jgi:trehalose 6-phosphate phosphatase
VTPLQAASLPSPGRAALLLDLDGTLLDIAPTPDSVVVPAALLETLRGLLVRLDGALAVISGRPVAQVDALLHAIPTAVAGEHGGAFRFASGAPLERVKLPSAPAAWLAAAERIAAKNPGVLLERKERGFVLHYRAVPELGQELHAALQNLVGQSEAFTVMRARKAWEIKPRGADKGTAVAALMAHPPFAGRLPIFIGDDVTDEDGMAMARARGGAGLRVGDALANPAAVRAWLAEAAHGADRWPG